MIRFILIFIVLSIMATLGVSFFDMEFGKESYWNNHGVFVLIFLTMFPRLTLIFSSIPTGGFLWWLGLLFCPRYLVALLATITYWQTNPILVTLSWVVALGGESTEKYYIHRRYYHRPDVIEVESYSVQDHKG